MGGVWGTLVPQKAFVHLSRNFRSQLCFKGRQKKSPSFQDQSLSSFMLYMVPLSRIFYSSFCKGDLRVESYLLVSHISSVDFV